MLKNQHLNPDNSPYSSYRSENMNWQNPDPQMVDIVQKHLIDVKDSLDIQNSLKLQGGDITRDLYKWSNEQESITSFPLKCSNPPIISTVNNRRRSMSFTNVPVISSDPIYHSLDMSANDMRAPNGFRRSFIMHRNLKLKRKRPSFITRNFIEFLTLYGHFAGEDLSEDERDDQSEYDEILDVNEDVFEDEESSLLPKKCRPKAYRDHNTSTFKAILLLLKSFVGTGVLFLPKGFHNGGWVFSSSCLLFCGLISYYCFMLLVKTKNKMNVDGYGDLGLKIYGRKVQVAVLSSIVLSQIGFSAAYTVFTATNLRVFFNSIFNWNWSLTSYIFLQLVIYVPLSLTRNIAKLSGTALIADLFILLGLIYVYYYCAYHVSLYGISKSTMVKFNKLDWSLFVGTAIFTYEGIGLLIPIQESMKHPEKFQSCLMWVMVAVTIVFISCGLLCYSAYGSDVETVILLNFPEDSIFTMGVQFLYAIAILLSTPLQLFPAIKILENSTFSKDVSGKFNSKIKWLKNWFRCLVVLVAMFVSWIGANDLDKFVSLVGSFACIPLIYIYPPLLHYKSFQNSLSFVWLSLDLLILCFGIGIMFYTSYQSIYLWLT